MARKSKLEKTVDKQRKYHPVAFFLVILFLLLGALGGYFTLKFLTKEDCFLVLGEQTIYLDLGESFVDDGVKIIAFGKDISSDVKIERDENFDENVAGRYYVKYTIDNLRYKGVVKYRYVVFVDGNEEAGVVG